MTKINLWDENIIQQENKRIKYLITAGENRYKKQQYVYYYNDTEQWDISTIPLPLSKTKAIQLLPKIKKQYQERIETDKLFATKYKDIQFELIEYNKENINKQKD